MTEKPAGNGPTDPTPDETPQPTEAQPPRDETVRLPDDTIPLHQETAETVAAAPAGTGTAESEAAGSADAGSDAVGGAGSSAAAAGDAATGADGSGDAGTGPGDVPPPGSVPPPGGFPPPGSVPPPGGFPPPGSVPPPGGFPPPSGSFFPPPQPTGGAFATRYGLIRPLHGRWFAGVAAAIGRATNTDPVLWRVLLAVMTLFGGVGLLIYLLGWLLIPAEGDSASAAEALIGRGHSSTSAAVTLGLAVFAVIMFLVAFSGSVRASLLGAAVILGAAVLVSRGGMFGRPANRPPQPGSPPPPWAPTTGGPFAPTTPPASAPSPGSPAAPTTPFPTTPFPAADVPTTPFAATATESGTTEAPAGYRPPFAPHGPYASSSPYARSLGYPPPAPPQYPGLGQPVPPPKPPKPPRERSRLGRIVLSLVCLALGVLAIYDINHVDIPVAAYVAVPLGIIGLGLVVGAWLGRARWLVFPGLALTVALVIVTGAEQWNATHVGIPRGDVAWTPANVSELTDSYRTDAGNATLDLSQVDFRDHEVAVNVRADVGNLVVILPPDVDVDVTAKVDVGGADVLGQAWSGMGNSTRSVSDNGADGPGGGKLRLMATVDLGKLEVHR